MGVAFGRFVTTPAYSALQTYCIEHRNSWVLIPELTVCLTSSVPIECSGGVQIIDFSPELGEAGIEVHVNGITNPPYRELFQDQEKATGVGQATLAKRSCRRSLPIAELAQHDSS